LARSHHRFDPGVASPLTALEHVRSQTGWIAGLNHGFHDAACALLSDGKLVVATEQERLSRRKHARDEAPALALARCLEEANITLEDLDVVALGSDHVKLTAWLGEPPAAVDLESPSRLFPPVLFGEQRRPPVVRVRHHLAHAASAAWPSGLPDVGVLVMDAMGEDSATALGRATKDGVAILETLPIETSLGYFYEAASEYCGLGRDAVGKLMGLAAYGTATDDVGLHWGEQGIEWRHVRPTDKRGRALIEDRIAQLLKCFEACSFPHLSGCYADIMSYANFAASVQKALEYTVLQLARRVRDLSGSRNLALAGGVALNCSANGALADTGLFDHIWIQPMANDAGVGLGAALIAAHRLGHDVARKARMPHAFWGPRASRDEIATAFERHGLTAGCHEMGEVVERAAAVLANSGVVAWHQGRAEVGPRALGARSFLGDPRTRESLVRLNTIKGREMWRPVAPSVLAERFHDYFEGTPNDFMLVAAHVRSHVRREVPAIVHVDGSARPQTVRDETNRPFAALLRAVGRRTGHPLVINTSLNLEQSPICCSPDDTVCTFLDSAADAVVIDNWLALR
jgi:carbamoyltransferase